MKIQSINNVSCKGLPAQKLAPEYGPRIYKKAKIKQLWPDLQQKENNVGKTVKKALPRSVDKEEAVKISYTTNKKIVDCGSWSDWCGGGWDICGSFY